MTTKLTLTIDDTVIHSAKKYAQSKGKSLSDVVENYLKVLSNENEKDGIAPQILKMKGSIELPEDFDYKKELAKAITTKHNA